MHTPHRKRLPSQIFTGLAVVVLLLGIASSIYTYIAIDRSAREHILDRANTMAQMLPAGGVAALSGTELDEGTNSYEHIKELLMNVRSVNSDMRFAYLIGMRDEQLFFYVDSEDPSSEDYSPPGQTYEEAPRQMYEVFDDGHARSDGPTADRWGVWVSGYVPVFSEDGSIIALLGIDLPARDFIVDTLAYAALPLLVSILMLAFLLAAKRIRAREEEALEERAEFLSIASHEIRTPLTGVRWALEDMLTGKTELPTEARESLAQVHDVATRLVERLNNLLEVTKLEQRGIVSREVVRMRPFLDDIAKSFTLAARQKNVSVVLEDSVTPELEARIDEGVMRHIFFNLLSNAIKYTKEGTSVRVGYERVPRGHAFSVTDEGEGIPENERKEVFAGYHRAQTHEHAGIEGTGLGLYLVQKAVELLGGTVAIADGETGGARLTITLPE